MAKANFIFYSAYKYKNNSYDEVLLPEISSYLAQNKEEKLIIFVHLMGSHGNAADRYPKEFNFYQNEMQKHRLVPQQQVNEYDNSVLYNDSIMNSLYHIADSYHIKSVLYFSDHGDEVGSDVAFLGHSYTIGSKAMLEIPFLIYTKDNKIKAKLKDKTNKLWTTYWLSNFLESYLGIKTNQYQEDLDILSNGYKEPSKILLQIKDSKYYYKKGKILAY